MLTQLKLIKVIMLALIPMEMQEQQRKFLIVAASQKEEMASKLFALFHAFLPISHYMCK
jgi:hypothetical protein